MSINLFFEGYDSVNHYQESILKEINERIPFDKCVLTSKDNDGSDVYAPEKYVKINYDMCVNGRYELSVNMSSLLPLSRELLHAMEPYEPMAVKMLCRLTEFDMLTYEEAKRFYLHHLRFWNDVFERHQINYVFMTGIPHHTHDYIIYALTKIKKIPMCILAPTHLPHWCFVGNDLYQISERLDAAYADAMAGVSAEPVQGMTQEASEAAVTLPEDVEAYYQALLRENKRKKMQVMLGAGSRAEHAKREMRHIMDYALRDRVMRRQFLRLKHGLAASVREKSLEPWKTEREWMKKDAYWVSRVRHKLKNCITLAEYEKLTVMPDMKNEKYVILLLHQQPEATTLPQAGVFVEQEVGIQMLAYALKPYGIKLYVKEHFVQPYRMKGFYKDLKETENVVLVSSDAESVDLLENCVAAATFTGTVTLEAIANGKPVMVFGHGGFEHGPGIYQVGCEAECKQAIENILKTPTVRNSEVRKYFKAFVDSSICVYSPIENADSSLVEKSRKEIIDLAVCELQKVFG